MTKSKMLKEMNGLNEIEEAVAGEAAEDHEEDPSRQQPKLKTLAESGIGREKKPLQDGGNNDNGLASHDSRYESFNALIPDENTEGGAITAGDIHLRFLQEGHKQPMSA